MTTQIELNDDELREVCEATHQADASAAIRTALAEYLRFIKLRELAEWPGRIWTQLDWKEPTVDSKS